MAVFYILPPKLKRFHVHHSSRWTCNTTRFSPSTRPCRLDSHLPIEFFFPLWFGHIIHLHILSPTAFGMFEQGRVWGNWFDFEFLSSPMMRIRVMHCLNNFFMIISVLWIIICNRFCFWLLLFFIFEHPHFKLQVLLFTFHGSVYFFFLCSFFKYIMCMWFCEKFFEFLLLLTSIYVHISSVMVLYVFHVFYYLCSFELYFFLLMYFCQKLFLSSFFV